MKKPYKKPTYTGDEMKRYLGVIHEEHMDGLKAIGEQFIDVNRKLDEHTRLLDSHTEMIGGLAVRMTSVEAKLDSVETKVGGMEMKMTVMQEDIEFIKSGLKRKVDQEEFDALIRRVSVLERRVLK